MILLMVSLATGFTACTKDDTPGSGSTTSTSTSAIIVQGNWKVTYFINNGTDKTSSFAGFSFKFIAGGTVAASNSLLAVNGTWSSYNDDSQNKLLLNFPNSLSFADLNKDWHITEKTSARLVMENISGGGGAASYLTIEKI